MRGWVGRVRTVRFLGRALDGRRWGFVPYFPARPTDIPIHPLPLNDKKNRNQFRERDAVGFTRKVCHVISLWRRREREREREKEREGGRGKGWRGLWLTAIRQMACFKGRVGILVGGAHFRCCGMAEHVSLFLAAALLKLILIKLSLKEADGGCGFSVFVSLAWRRWEVGGGRKEGSVVESDSRWRSRNADWNGELMQEVFPSNWISSLRFRGIEMALKGGIRWTGSHPHYCLGIPLCLHANNNPLQHIETNQNK